MHGLNFVLSAAEKLEAHKLFCYAAVIFAASLMLGVKIWQVMSWQKSFDAPQPPTNIFAVPPLTESRISSISLKDVANFHLMGIPAPEPEIVEVVELPPTRLVNLILMGTFTDTNTELASAFISADSRPATRFFVGSTIIEGVILKDVKKQSVTLARQGSLEVLYFPNAKLPDFYPKPVHRRNLKTNAVQLNTHPIEDQSNPGVSLLESLRQRNGTQPNAQP